MFIYNLENIAKKLKIDYEGVTNKIKHNGVKGTAREDLLKEYLKRLLPEKYAISSGIIIDYNQNQSKQQDFIIYDAFDFPNFFQTQSNSVLPIESVYATIEVKSSLTYANLKDAVENIKSVRKLHRLKNKNDNNNQIYPLGFIFAYTSKLSLEKILLKLNELYKNTSFSEQVSAICILDKGIIISALKSNISQISIVPSYNTIYTFSESKIKESLYSFYLILLEYLNSIKISVPSLIEYAKKMNAFNITLNIPSSLISDDLYYDDGKEKINVKEFIKNDKAREIFDKYPWVLLREGATATYGDMKKFLKKDFFKLLELNQDLSDDFHKRLISFLGYDFDPKTFAQFESDYLNYSKNEECKKRYDDVIKQIWEKYKENYL